MNTEYYLNGFLSGELACDELDQSLSAATLAVQRWTPVEDGINWKEHVRRYHNGSFDPRVDKCEIYDRMKKAEEDSESVSPTDADGDGLDDDYSKHPSYSASQDSDLSEHDARRHGGHFDPNTQRCTLREHEAKIDLADSLEAAASEVRRDAASDYIGDLNVSAEERRVASCIERMALSNGTPDGVKRIKVAFQTVTPESAENGDFEETGWDDEEGESFDTVAEAARWMSNEKGAMPLDGSADWFETQVDQNRDYFERGAETTYQLFPSNFTVEELHELNRRIKDRDFEEPDED
ncbi:MAG: hypothetical protein MJZ81_09170 [Bacteroidales bacterium]|nr:hypothetical protein [Bacteroidales bacterium]